MIVISPRSAAIRLAWMAPIALLLVAASCLLGYTPIEWRSLDGWREFLSGSVLWTHRAPRVALAAVAGAGLALGGAVFQALFRNPLAEPYTLGIASGAALGAAIGFLFRVGGYVLWVPKLAFLALLGGMAAMLIVLSLSRHRAGVDMTRLLLGGICVAYTCSALILLITFLAGKPVTNDLVMWMMGSLSLLRWQAWIEVAFVLGPVALFALASHRALDLLATGDELAAARGVAVSRTIWLGFGSIGILTAAIVANCGPIGFVGLLVPHMVRAIVGPRALHVITGSILSGAAFLAVCDGLARSLSSQELPVGILTNILGAGFFFFLISRRDPAASSQLS